MTRIPSMFLFIKQSSAISVWPTFQFKVIVPELFQDRLAKASKYRQKELPKLEWGK